MLLPLRTPGHGGARISIPRVILDSLPLGAEEHMWISDDRTQRLTAQRRRRLSSDVMHLSSPGESAARMEGKKNGIIRDLVIGGFIRKELKVTQAGRSFRAERICIT